MTIEHAIIYIIIGLLWNELVTFANRRQAAKENKPYQATVPKHFLIVALWPLWMIVVTVLVIIKMGNR